jgi:hypothetical protein
MPTSLPVVNLDAATFECTYGRGCDGVCCKGGRPPVYPEEEVVIRANLAKVLPLMAPAARRLVEREGFLSRRVKFGQPSLRVSEGWCVFFHGGCVLHAAGAAEGDPYKYKPAVCALFPIQRNARGEWYVRQWGYENEPWDLFCLNPARTSTPAAESLRAEVALAAAYDAAEGRGGGPESP